VDSMIRAAYSTGKERSRAHLKIQAARRL